MSLIEKITDQMTPFVFLLPGFLDFFMLRLDRKAFLSGSRSIVETQIESSENSKTQIEKKKNPEEVEVVKKVEDDGSLCREEVEFVMEKMGFFCRPEHGILQERLCSEDVSSIFEEKEPSLDEIKEAFDVFDQNKDGFIDAVELQRVLCFLGLKEGTELENCRMMIRVFDENKDDRIDFKEFVKFMENSFC